MIPKGPQPAPASQSHKSWIWLIALVFAGGAGYALYPRLIPPLPVQAQKKTSGRHEPSGPVPVLTVVARRGDMPVYLDGIGSVTAFYTVQLRTRVDGQLIQVNYREGQLVQQGEPLIEIDPRPFEVQIEQAQGQLAKDQALLGQAKANMARDVDAERYARAEAERYGNLFHEGIVSREQGDQIQTTADTQADVVAADRAAIDSAKAQTVADQAAIDNARLQLSYAHITSPVTGRIGLRLVDPGNVVHAADASSLAVITQLQPIAVVFSIPEDSLQEVIQRLGKGVTLPVFAFDRDMTKRLASGKLLSMDNEIDQTTGTVKLKAVFDNADLSLFPNQFVNARLRIDSRRNVVLVPTAAVQHSPRSAYVYLVKPDKTVEVRDVTVGIAAGDQTSIEEGLDVGDQVVIDGLDKLQQGTAVSPRLAKLSDRSSL